MHLNAKPPVFVPVEYRREMEKLSKAALMDIAWDYAVRSVGEDQGQEVDHPEQQEGRQEARREWHHGTHPRRSGCALHRQEVSSPEVSSDTGQHPNQRCATGTGPPECLTDRGQGGFVHHRLPRMLSRGPHGQQVSCRRERCGEGFTER